MIFNRDLCHKNLLPFITHALYQGEGVSGSKLSNRSAGMKMPI